MVLEISLSATIPFSPLGINGMRYVCNGNLILKLDETIYIVVKSSCEY